jgi:hypothetical protein
MRRCVHFGSCAIHLLSSSKYLFVYMCKYRVLVLRKYYFIEGTKYINELFHVLTSSGEKAVPFSELISLHGKEVCLSYDIPVLISLGIKQSQVKNFSELEKILLKADGKE